MLDTRIDEALRREGLAREVVNRVITSYSIHYTKLYDPSAVVARILRYFAVDVPSLPYDSRDSLVHAILDHTADEEALVRNNFV